MNSCTQTRRVHTQEHPCRHRHTQTRTTHDLEVCAKCVQSVCQVCAKCVPSVQTNYTQQQFMSNSSNPPLTSTYPHPLPRKKGLFPSIFHPLFHVCRRNCRSRSRSMSRLAFEKDSSATQGEIDKIMLHLQRTKSTNRELERFDLVVAGAAFFLAALHV